MKINKVLLATAVSAVTVMTSCEKSPIAESELTSAVKFSSSIANQVATRAVNNAWENNDAIGVYMKTGSGLANVLGDNKQYVTPNTTGNFAAASSANELFYPTDGSSVDFIAYYPYQTSFTANTYKVNVADQSQQNKIDLLYADNAKGLSKSNTNAALVFNHKLAKVEVTVSAGTGVTSLSGLGVQFNGFNTTADFDLASGVLSNAAAPAAFNAKTTAGATTTVAEAILLPASNITNASVVFQLASQKFTWKLANTTTYEAGKKYLYNIQLTTDANGQTAVVVSATITNWTDVPSGSYTIIKDEDGGTTPNPGTGTEQVLYAEDFGTVDIPSSSRPKIDAYTGWSNKSVTYTGIGNADVRSLVSTANHMWIPSTGTNIPNINGVTISGINTAGASNLKLSFKIAANLSGSGSFDLANLSIIVNSVTFHPASRVLSLANGSQSNTFYDAEIDMSSIQTIPATSTLTISTELATNTTGVRIDDLSLSGVK